MDTDEKQKLREKIIALLAGRPYIFQSDPERQKIDGVSNGAFANLVVQGKGPAGGFYVGRRKAFTIEAYADWLIGRIHTKEEG